MNLIERPKSLTVMVTEKLLQSIVDGTIKLGSLLSEKQMAETFGTSKTPVREAFAHLQTLGLMEVIPQKGGIVFSPDVEQVRELCEIRQELEVTGLKFSMEKNRAAFTAHLAGVVQKMIEVFDVEHPIPYQRLDNDFHYSFFLYCGNSMLMKVYDSFSPRICALRTYLSTPQVYLLNRSFEEHKAMLEFIKQGDVNSTVLMLREHIIRTRECHSRVLMEAEASAQRRAKA